MCADDGDFHQLGGTLVDSRSQWLRSASYLGNGTGQLGRGVKHGRPMGPLTASVHSHWTKRRRERRKRRVGGGMVVAWRAENWD